MAEDLAGGGVHDGDVEILNEQGDVGSGVGSADADVPELAGDPEGDGPGGPDLAWRTRSWVSARRSPLGAALGNEVERSRGSRDVAAIGVAGGCY